MANWMTGATMGFQLGLGYLTAMIQSVNTDFSKAGVAFVPRRSEAQSQVEKQVVKIGVIVYTWADIVGDTGGDYYPI